MFLVQIICIISVSVNSFLYFCGNNCNVELSKMNNLIEHTGVVQAKQEGAVVVLITQSSACSSCHAKSACTAADKSEKQVEALVLDDDIAVGDVVVVYGQRKLGMKAVFWAFIAPFVLLFITLILLQQTELSEVLRGTVSLATLIPYYVVLSFFRESLKKEFCFYARKA